MKIKTYNPKKTAFCWIYSIDNLLFNRKIKLDMRFKTSKEVLKLINQYQITENEKKRILHIRKQRCLNRIEPVENILSNKLVKDYLLNRFYLNGVFDDHLRFSGRNHWAKNKTDFKILDILKKYYLKKMAVSSR